MTAGAVRTVLLRLATCARPAARRKGALLRRENVTAVLLSLLLHVVSAAATWYIVPDAMGPWLDRTVGGAGVVRLESRWVDCQRPQPKDEVAARCTQVLILPERAQVAEHRYVQATTRIERPEPRESPDGAVVVAPAAVQRAQTATAATDVATVVSERRARHPISPLASLTTTASDPAASSLAEGVGGDHLPRLLRNRPPVYPPQAVQRGFQGTVVLLIQVTEDGLVGQLDLAESSGHSVLDAAAMYAVRTWRFAPARAGGRAVAATVRLPIRFSLE